MAVECSFCHVTAVHHHCAEHNTACTWLRCHACGAIVDWATDKAMAKDGTQLDLRGEE